jgi:hypothetical protein
MNGDKYRTGKRTPEGDPDPSVFSTDYSRIGIQVGTAVSLLCRDGEQGANTEEAEVHYREFWGNGKRERLLESADLTDAEGYEALDPPLKLGLPLMPRSTGDDYLGWPKITDLYASHFSGVTTARDDVVVDVDRERLEKRMEEYFDPDVSDREIAERYPRLMKSTSEFNPQQTRDYLVKRGFLKEQVVPYGYRPLDLRWLYWEPETKLLDRERSDYMPHVFEGNRWFTSTKRYRKETFYRPQFTRHAVDYNYIEANVKVFPLYLDPEVSGDDLFSQPDADESGEPIPNLSDPAASYLDSRDAGVETLFYHTIATLHAPTYRQENEGALRQDWPRVPLPEDGDVLQRSAELGRQVAALLDVEQEVEGVTAGTIRPELRPLGVPTPASDKDRLSREDFEVTAGWGYTAHHGATMPAGGEYEERSLTPEEETALPEGAAERLGGSTCDIYLNDSAYWQHVPNRVWDYTLGGYPVIKKWLSYREKDVLGRQLKLDEVQHVTSMTRRIAALLLLEPRLNDNYERVKGSTQ